MLKRILRPSFLPRQSLVPATNTFLSPPLLRSLSTTTTTISPPAATTPPPPPPAADTSLSLLPLLRAQPQHYITVHIHSFPFLVTLGDTITLPFRLKGVVPGQTLRLTHASVLGSRDYTLKGNPWIDEKLYSCRATVVEETSEPMRVKEKTKRRQRKIKKVKSKHPYTVLRIKELVVNGGEEVEV
ncbi:ribosomal protein L21-like protein [Trichophaea hybrida]|nr:ribosomal protein L21-like protein [Trichophaea hybrida]